jgi:predicted O-linked N-acetylglucosamine transferase (SPINDLY family)
LAPVQAVGWGHPDTTGLDSVDYFLSAAAIEPDGADDHYRERLIRLDRLPCYYEPPAAPSQLTSRAALGLPENCVLLGCPQSLFKFHPDFDRVLAAIADGEPAARIVLLAGATPAWTDQLRARWARSYPILSERVMFLPRLPLDRFLALLDRVDVLLDPLHFGAGNSFYEAAAFGAPTITWPGRFMRGRIVAGAYRQMELTDAPVAGSPDAYVSVALDWARDPDRCRAFRHAIRKATTTELLADVRAVRSFEAFLEAAVASAAREEKLSLGWNP